MLISGSWSTEGCAGVVEIRVWPAKMALGTSGSEQVIGTRHSSGHWRGRVLRRGSLMFLSLGFGVLFVLGFFGLV